MKKKFVFKIAVDMVMTVLLLFLMARQITGDLFLWPCTLACTGI